MLENEKEEQEVETEAEVSQSAEAAAVEEAAVPEKKPVSESAKDASHTPIAYGGEEQLLQHIEENQKTFAAYFKKNKSINTLIIVIFMVAIMAAIFLLGSISGTYMALILVLVVIYFIVLYVFSKFTKKKLNADATKLIGEYFDGLDSYITDQPEFSDVRFNFDEKLEEESIRNLRLVKSIEHIGGRDVITGSLLGSSFRAGDVLIKTQETDEKGKKQQFIVFLGKMFICDIEDIVPEGRAVLYLKGKGANGPTDIEDLEEKTGVLSEKYAVYASCDIASVLNGEARELLEQYETNATLIDMFITIDSKHLSFGFSYSDDLMRVPLFDPLVPEAVKQYKRDVERMVAFLKAVKK